MSSPVVTEGGAMPAGTPVTVKFTELGLSEPLLRAVAETGYTTPTPIQAQGIPLRKIREELYGKSLADLAAFEKLAARKGQKALADTIPLAPVSAPEDWSVHPLDRGFLLVNREKRHLPQTVIQKINQLILSVHPANQDRSTLQKN